MTQQRISISLGLTKMKNFKRFRTLPCESKRRIVLKYALFQIPDILILILILLVLRWWMDLPLWLYGCIVSLWIIKDFLTFPLVWRAYDTSHPGDVKSLIGIEGVAEEKLDPSGYIRVHGELWQAEVMENKAPIEKGEMVMVEAAYGLTLLVQPTQKR
jgi:membrane protein implicated in regulation of membrane protease activity